jgi:DNA-binding XRE family transcriptional regulator
MIYFVKHTDYVKIGYTADIYQRLNQLQVNCPVKLKVLGLIQGDLNDEAIHHEKFKHISSNGEWFFHNAEIDEYISTLNKDLMWEYGFENEENYKFSKIKKCRLDKNMSLEELGNLLGISKQAVLDMEKREVQGRISIASILNCFDVMGYEFQYRAVPKK